MTETYGDGSCGVCGARIRPGLLMCAVHWRRVPGELQREVYAALDAYNAGTATLGDLRAVQDRAVQAATQ